jgi:hypothetical protein
MAGGAEWVDPNISHRATTYTCTEDRREHRIRYMKARAEIEDTIPEAVLIAMIAQGYDIFGCNEELEDLCSLLSVVRHFMKLVVAVVSACICFAL